MNDKIIFRCLEFNDIEECAKMISKTFALFDPFLILLNVTESELLDIVKQDLINSYKDNHITIAVEKSTNKIIGCYAGFKLSRFTISKVDQQQITIDISNIKNISFTEKLKILDQIDNNMLSKYYLKHKANNELEKVVFCDYFCIDADYFKSNLAANLAYEFFKNCLERGIQQLYGSFFNIKAINVLKKNFPIDIVDKLKVIFKTSDNEQDNNDFDVYLITGDKNLKLNKPKF